MQQIDEQTLYNEIVTNELIVEEPQGLSHDFHRSGMIPGWDLVFDCALLRLIVT